MQKLPGAKNQEASGSIPADASKLLSAIIETMPGGLFTVDARRVVTSWNQRMTEITGYEASEVLGRTCDMLEGNTCFGKECRPESGCSLFSHGVVRDRRCTLRHKDGRHLTVLKNSRLMKDELGKITGGIELVTDLSAVLALEEQVALLKSEVSGRSRFKRLVGRHPVMLRLHHLIELAGRSPSTVVIQGETGTGKELVAQAIHDASPRARESFVKVSCAALTEALLESELFGHVKGAFTGAYIDRKGRFEEASGGTILLDEVGDMSPTIQTKLLRVLQEREIERVGENRPIPVDLRVIVATHKDLALLSDQGAFRKDLFFRLNVVPIRVPPLRERIEDLPLLVEHFVGRLNRSLGRAVAGVAPEALRLLMAHSWSGNVRELENAIEFGFVVAADGDWIQVDHLPASLRQSVQDCVAVVTGGGPESGPRPHAHKAPRRSGLAAEEIRAALRQTGDNKTRAARILGVSRVTLHKWIKKLGMHREEV